MKSCPLFDTHAHYDHPLFGEEGSKILKQLFDEGIVDGVVIPPISFRSNFNRDLFPRKEFPSVFFAVGVHPLCIDEHALEAIYDSLELDRIIGMPGTAAIKTDLDFHKEKLILGPKTYQYMSFEYFIGRANRYRMPMVLHVRDALEDTINTLSEKTLDVEAEVHCFTYDFEAAKALMDVGVTRFGIGGMLTRPEMEHLRDCVKRLPLSAILLETDAPFVRPAGYGDGPNTSRTLMQTAELIAQLREIPVEEVIEAVQQNAKDFFRLEQIKKE